MYPVKAAIVITVLLTIALLIDFALIGLPLLILSYAFNFSYTFMQLLTLVIVFRMIKATIIAAISSKTTKKK